MSCLVSLAGAGSTSDRVMAQGHESPFFGYERSIVKITVTGKDPDHVPIHPPREGSGVIFYSDKDDNKSLILTAAHVLGNEEDFGVSNGRLERTIRVEALDANNVLQVISHNATVYDPIQLSSKLDVAVLSIRARGYPVVKLPTQRLRSQTIFNVRLLGFKQGRRTLSSVYQPGTGALNHAGYLETSVPSQAGESGGAWIDENSRIVLGIASRVNVKPGQPSNIATSVDGLLPHLGHYIDQGISRAKEAVPLTKLPNDPLFSELAAAYSDKKIEFPKLKAVTLAQWAVESAFGRSEIAQRHYNFASLQYLQKTKNCHKVTIEAPGRTTEFCRFASIDAFIEGYWARLDNANAYNGWRDHADDPEAFLDFIAPRWAPGSRPYKDKILSALKVVVSRGLLKDETEGAGTPIPLGHATLPSDLLVRKGRSEKRVALLVAHSARQPGATGVAGIKNEFQMSESLLKSLGEQLQERGISARLFYRNLPGGAGVKKRDLHAYLWQADLAIELHGNAANGRARGSETIYDSRYSKRFARVVHDAVITALARSGRQDRGLRDVHKDRFGRGELTVSNWSVPTVILEPAFIDNEEDAKLLQDRRPQVIDALAHAIQRYLNEAPDIEHGAPEDNYVPPQDLSGFVISIQRTHTEKRGGHARTVGHYQVFYKGVKLPGLEGTTVENGDGIGDNTLWGGAAHRRRIKALSYPLYTHGGTKYKTFGYASTEDRRASPRPAVLLGQTGERRSILIHPASGFKMSVGTINLSKMLSGPEDDIDWVNSRNRVIALIEAMKDKLGAQFPANNGKKIPNAWVVISGEPTEAKLSQDTELSE